MQESERRIVVVNADDFGLSDGVSRAIIRAHAEGIVTSTSVMVRQPAVERAIERARRHPELGLGLHLDLGEWTLRDGAWQPLYSVVDTEDESAVAAEIERQLERFRALVGAEPTHIDSHQHVHRNQPIATVVRALARSLDVPLRHTSRGARYHGDFYGQDAQGATHEEWTTVDALVALIGRIEPGVSEIACHPGEPDDSEIASTMYRAERALELEALCDRRVRESVDTAGIELRSFRDMGFVVVP
jgi:chitin disaccharide deacetylase